ncbi:MAG: FAD-dependent oxidoreductase [Devosia sp.]
MRLAADAAHQFGGIDLDRSTPLSFTLDGIKIEGFAGDTVLSAVLAAGIDTYGLYGGVPMALTDRFGPLVASKRGAPLPMDRLPAIDGADLTSLGQLGRRSARQPNSLRHILDKLEDPGWLRAAPEATLSADLLIIGGGVTGLAAAKSAAVAGRTVIVAERRAWFGGDARYFGPVGDEETPEIFTTRLLDWLAANTNVTMLGRTEAFALQGPRAMLHQIEMVEGAARGRVVAVNASRVLLATGATQRLPVFPGNRLPGVLPAIFAYHLAKRYGVAHGDSAVVATQGNFGYRLALRLSDAGVAIRRVVDTRINAQSRFIDFAKAGGLTLASGQIPLSAQRGHFTFAPILGSGASVNVEARQLVIAGGWQPDLTLWMQAGGNVRWSSEQAAMVATGHVDHIGLAGSAVGYRSMKACTASGRAAQAALFGDPLTDVEDSETGTALETPDEPTPTSPHASALPSFLDAGRSLAVRPSAVQSGKVLPRSQAMSLADAAASVELQLIAPGDAGAIAEERGAPGADLVASDWRPSAGDVSDALPVYLTRRFGDDPQRVHLIVDNKRTFLIGALVYSNVVKPDPGNAAGVIIDAAPIGGIALMQKSALTKTARFIVETGTGPSPARIAPG